MIAYKSSVVCFSDYDVLLFGFVFLLHIWLPLCATLSSNQPLIQLFNFSFDDNLNFSGFSNDVIHDNCN